MKPICPKDCHGVFSGQGMLPHLQHLRSHEDPTEAAYELVIGDTPIPAEQVEDVEGLVLKVILRPVGLEHPFSAETLSLTEHFLKPALVEHHPSVKVVVLGMRGGIRYISGPRQGDDGAVNPSYTYVGPVQFLLDNDPVVPIAGLHGADVSLSLVTMMVARAQPTPGQMGDGAV